MDLRNKGKCDVLRKNTPLDSLCVCFLYSSVHYSILFCSVLNTLSALTAYSSLVHLYFTECIHLLQKSPSWTDVGTTFVGEQQHLHAHCAVPLLICRSGEEEGGGKRFFSEITLVMLKSWYWLTTTDYVEEEPLLHSKLSGILMHLWAGQFPKFAIFWFKYGLFMLKKYPLKSCPSLNHCKLIENHFKLIRTLPAIYFLKWIGTWGEIRWL